MNKCYLGLGSNQDFPARQIRQAIASIGALPQTCVYKISSLYWNKAWGNQRQQDFCNVVIEIATLLPPKRLLTYCQGIEIKQGRIRKRKWGPRTLDIDLLWYEKRRIKTAKLTLPHPYLFTRDFVLIPLKELIPSLLQT